MTRFVFCGIWLSLLAACGGGSGGGQSDPGGERARTPAANALPSAQFDLYQDDGHGPMTVSVYGGPSGDPEGDPLTYRWDFGDRTQASGVAASHTYAEPGAYTITLTVTDSVGGSGQTGERVTVEDEELVCDSSV